MTLNAMPDDRELTLAPLDGKVDHLRGSPAGHLIIEYGDYECHTGGRHFHAIERVEQSRGGNMRFAFRHFPLTGSARTPSPRRLRHKPKPAPPFRHDPKRSWTVTGCTVTASPPGRRCRNKPPSPTSPSTSPGVSQHFKTWVDMVIAERRMAAGTKPVLVGKPAVLVTVRGGNYRAGTPPRGMGPRDRMDAPHPRRRLAA
jgi:hypothetical protein